ncbi:hypothetical protein [Enterococcus avium]|nr:hypothetical protein [Enterococcus avium]
MLKVEGQLAFLEQRQTIQAALIQDLCANIQLFQLLVRVRVRLRQLNKN